MIQDILVFNKELMIIIKLAKIYLNKSELNIGAMIHLTISKSIITFNNYYLMIWHDIHKQKHITNLY